MSVIYDVVGLTYKNIGDVGIDKWTFSAPKVKGGIAYQDDHVVINYIPQGITDDKTFNNLVNINLYINKSDDSRHNTALICSLADQIKNNLIGAQDGESYVGYLMYEFLNETQILDEPNTNFSIGNIQVQVTASN